MVLIQQMQGDKVKVGVWGGKGGNSWQYDGPIEKIVLNYGSVIDSISFGSTKFGGNGGGNTQVRLSTKL